MAKTYAILGAGRQGTAAAYDIAEFDVDSQLIMMDRDASLAQQAADRLNGLLGRKQADSVEVDATDGARLRKHLESVDGLLCSLPYKHNLKVTDAAIDSGTHMVDLGGNTTIVFAQHDRNSKAIEKQITIVPDAGLAPGLAQITAAYLLGKLPNARHIHTVCGGLPQKPHPPFDYLLTFNVHGLINEYAEPAVELRNGERVEVPCFSEHEEMTFPEPFGQLEAFVTAGGSSTLPWTMAERLQSYSYKTLRTPGHAVKFRAFRDLGLFDQEAVTVGETSVVPRDVLATLLHPRIDTPGDPDHVLLRTTASTDTGIEMRLDIIDAFDEATGFRAMERLTGFPAAILLQDAVHGKLRRGVLHIETDVDPVAMMTALRNRHIQVAMSGGTV